MFLNRLNLVLPLLILAVVSGCVSKSRARLEARAAYVAGQEQAMSMVQKQQAAPSVRVVGDVKNTTIPWRDELTLAQAIVAAEYVGRNDPSSIVIIRDGQPTLINSKEFLHGNDVPLKPGDVVQLRR